MSERARAVSASSDGRGGAEDHLQQLGLSQPAAGDPPAPAGVEPSQHCRVAGLGLQGVQSAGPSVCSGQSADGRQAALRDQQGGLPLTGPGLHGGHPVGPPGDPAERAGPPGHLPGTPVV